MTKSSSWAIEMKMFIQFIFQNMKVIINVFLACMIRVGCGIGDLGHVNMNLITQLNKNELIKSLPKISF